jgi:hypothetical protein
VGSYKLSGCTTKLQNRILHSLAHLMDIHFFMRAVPTLRLPMECHLTGQFIVQKVQGWCCNQTPTVRTRQQYCPTHSFKMRFLTWQDAGFCTLPKLPYLKQGYKLLQVVHNICNYSLYTNFTSKMHVGCIAHNIYSRYFTTGLIPL